MACICGHWGRRFGAALCAVVLFVLGAGAAFGGTPAVVEAGMVNHDVSKGTITIDGIGSNTAVPATDVTAISALQVINGGHFFVGNDVMLTGNGALTIGGTTGSAGMQMWEQGDTADDRGYTLSMDGGTLNVGTAIAGSPSYGGFLETGKFHMTGGTVTVGGSTNPIGGGAYTDWPEAHSYITGGWALSGDENPGNAAVSLTGGIVNLETNGRIQTAYGDVGNKHLFHIGGNVVINMKGDGAALRAGASNSNLALEPASMLIESGTINVGTGVEGVILSRETEMKGGTINVASTGSLQIAGAAAAGTDIAAGVSTAIEKQGTFNISGGTIAAAGGVVDFVTGDMDLKASGGDIRGGLTITGTATGTGVLSKNLNVTGGSFTVDRLTIADISTSGLSTSGGVNVSGNLNITGSISVAGSLSNAFIIASSGSLTADASALLADIDDLETALGSNNNGTIYVVNGNETAYNNIIAKLGNNILMQNVTLPGHNNIAIRGTGSLLTHGDPIQNLPTRTQVNAISRAPISDVAFGGIVGAGGFDFYIPSGIDRNGLALTFNEAATLAGLGGVLVTANGYEYAPDVTAAKNLTLGNPNNASGTQGGKLGVVTMNGPSLNINNGSFALEGLRLNGNSMTLNSGAVATVNYFTGDIDGLITVNPDSALGLGTRDVNGLDSSLNANAPFLNGVTSALAIFNPMTLDGTRGGIAVGTTATVGNADFAAGSLLMVDAKEHNSRNGLVALTGTGAAAAIDADAKLYIYNAQRGTTVNVLDGFSGGIATNATGWTGANLSTDTPMLIPYATFAPDSVTVDLIARNAAAVYGNTPAAGVINALYQSGRNDVNSGDPGVAFLSRATSYLHNGPDIGRHLLALEGAANIASVAGAPSQSLSLTRMNTTAVRERFAFSTGFAQDASASTGAASDTAFANVLRSASSLAHGRLALWVKPVYQHTRVSGLPVGAYSNKLRGNMGGASLGADFTAGDNFRFGLATHFGGGKTKTENPALPATETSFAYGGLGLFAGWSSFDWSVLADTGYTYSNNDVTQNNPVASLSADPDTHAWNIGLTAEHRLSAGLVDIIPHAGVRYEGIYTERHTVAGAGMDVDGDTLHFATIPLGVRIGKAFISGKWTFSPYADLGALLTFGDRHATSSYTIAGIRGYGSRARTADTFAFDGKLGMQFENGRFFGGADYSLLKSKDTSTHTLSATFGVNF